MTQAAGASQEQEGACEVCAGLDVVLYDRAAEAHPAPFCGKCGRELGLALVDALPWPTHDFNRPRPGRAPDNQVAPIGTT